MSEQLATWIPAPIMAMAIIGMGAWIWKNLSRRLDKIEASIADFHKFATLQQLGNMGERFDNRQNDLREDIWAIRERVRVLEVDK